MLLKYFVEIQYRKHGGAHWTGWDGAVVLKTVVDFGSVLGGADPTAWLTHIRRPFRISDYRKESGKLFSKFWDTVTFVLYSDKLNPWWKCGEDSAKMIEILKRYIIRISNKMQPSLSYIFSAWICPITLVFWILVVNMTGIVTLVRIVGLWEWKNLCVFE